ncbi:MAG: hypothetical protein AB1640_09980 [bacterium]
MRWRRRAALRLAVLAVIALGLARCGGSDVERVRSEDQPCQPYGDSTYQGTYGFDGDALALRVSSASGQCCVVIGAEWVYQVWEITETTLRMAMQGEAEATWLRATGSAGDITGQWTGPDGELLDLREDSSFAGAGDPRCFEPAPCGAERHSRDVRCGTIVLCMLLPALFAWLLRARARARLLERGPGPS